MLQVGAIVFFVLAFTVLMLLGERLGPDYLPGFAFLVPLIGVAAAGVAFRSGRKRKP